MGEFSLNLGEILFVPVLVDDLGQWKGLLHLDGAMRLVDLRGDGLRQRGGLLHLVMEGWSKKEGW